MLREYKYLLPTEEADVLTGLILLDVLRRIPAKRITVDEQHTRVMDIAHAIENLSAFKKPTSKMKLKAVQGVASRAIRQISEAAGRLAKETTGDKWERETAFTEYRVQLRAALVSRLILIRTHDGMEQWRLAREAAIKIALKKAGVAAAYVVGAAAVLIVANAFRGEDLEKAHARGVRKRDAIEHARLDAQNKK
ncbi:MAG: hypothetical protein Q7S37_03290 [bacterium]|nr:hypothetical protein [bacterium]